MDLYSAFNILPFSLKYYRLLLVELLTINSFAINCGDKLAVIASSTALNKKCFIIIRLLVFCCYKITVRITIRVFYLLSNFRHGKVQYLDI